MAKAAKKPRKANGYKLPDPLPPGIILEDISKTKWKLGPSIGKGGFGEIYSAQEYASSKNSYPYVVKIEPHANGPLFVEMHFYMRNAKPDHIKAFQAEKKLKSFGMPKYLGSGRHEHNDELYRFIVMEKFGTDIWKLFIENNKRFPPETVFKIGIQILDVVEYIHSKGYIHADIKGANILLGPNAEANSQVYLVDFGLCTHYSANEKPDPKKAHNGTIEYVSRDGHLGIESRRGDLEILGYNLIQWFGCTLPWETNLSDPTAVQASKVNSIKNLPNFFKACFKDEEPPAAIVDYMKYVVSLKFETDPDYEKLRKILFKGLESAGGSLNSPFKFKTVKSPGKRKVISKSPAPKKKVKVTSKKEKVTNNVEPVNGTKEKSTKEETESIDKNDSTSGYTEEMRRIKQKLDSKKKTNVKKVEQTRTLRTRKDVNYSDISPSKVKGNNNVDVISDSESETEVNAKPHVTRRKQTKKVATDP